jgi:hypothetical protein
MRRRIGAVGRMILLAAGVAWVATSAEAAHGTATKVKGLVKASESAPAATAFDAEVDLQALYDEISQAGEPYLTGADFDQFRNALYAPDWVFIDASGRRHSAADLPNRGVQAQAPGDDSLIQRVDQLALVPGGATTVVELTTERTIVDKAGQYGRPGATHVLRTTTVYRDQWVKNPDGWQMKSREQLKPSRQAVDKPEWGS